MMRSHGDIGTTRSVQAVGGFADEPLGYDTTDATLEHDTHHDTHDHDTHDRPTTTGALA